MSMSYDDAFKVVLSSFERFENAARELRDEEEEDEEDSVYLHINSTYYAVVNRYESRIYVHLRNKYDKKKRMSMSYDDAFRVMLRNAERFMKAARSLEGTSDDDDDDEDEDDDDDDVDRAFKRCASITGDELTAKKSKTTVVPKRSRKRKHKD